MPLFQNLTEEQRLEVWSDLMSTWSGTGDKISVNKSDLKTVVDFTDQWLSDNYTTVYVNSPQQVVNSLSTKQLGEILVKIAHKKL